ncbi:MAG: PilW family protein [Pseudomonadales bacterium]|jgi:type IV pilus assembly protein PilW|nr:PilW family protein [Pseudomonadales bacterium]
MPTGFIRRKVLSRRTQGGFSVVELLIALGLGLLVVSGIVQLFIGNSRTYEIVNAQARLQENARFAFEFISRPARMAGFFGCAPEMQNIVGHLTGNWTNIPEYNVTERIDGWDSNDDGSWAPDNLTSLPRSEGGVDTNVHIAGNGIDSDTLQDQSDLLVFRMLRQPFGMLAATLQPDGDPVVSTPGGTPSFSTNDVVVVADCEQASVFKVTGVTAGSNEVTLARATAASGNAFDNSDNVRTPTGDIVPATMSIIGRSYGAETTVGVIESHFFFIAESSEVNNEGENIFALWQKVGAQAPRELVQGVQDMQILYGVDTTNNGQIDVDQYLTIDAVGEVNDIVAIQVRLTISSVDNLVEVGDRLTRTFSKTIHVRNLG